MKKIISLLILTALVFTFTASICSADTAVFDEEQEITTTVNLDLNVKSAVLMEAETGRLLYAKNPNEALPPASVTKVMTLLLVAEAIECGKINLGDKITVSSNAASMGGSQIFLKEGEEMTVEDLLKSTVIASANDGAVALAEAVAGSESAFVSLMNEKAKELGLKNTYFENTTGLDDTVTRHLTSSYDIAIMSKALIKYDFIMKYASLWQDTVRNGEFTLSNTNRLVRYYQGCTGLKTGSTDKAGFCISATAKRNGMHLIAVVMGAETRDERNNAARAMLDFGFSNYALFTESSGDIESIPVLRGKTNTANAFCEGTSFLVEKKDYSKIEKKYSIPESICAPISQDTVIGKIEYYVNDELVGSCNIKITETVEEINLFETFLLILKNVFTVQKTYKN